MVIFAKAPPTGRYGTKKCPVSPQELATDSPSKLHEGRVDPSTMIVAKLLRPTKMGRTINTQAITAAQGNQWACRRVRKDVGNGFLMGVEGRGWKTFEISTTSI